MQVIFIGVSTTNKSTIARQLCKQFPGWTRLDSDQEISKQFGSGIPDIYYHFSDKPTAEAAIARLENEFLEHLSTLPGNYILAAGPDIPLRENFQSYIDAVKPTVILLEKSVEEIYEGLISRRTAMRKKEKHQRQEFGIWDPIDEDMSRKSAFNVLRMELDNRLDIYLQFAHFRYDSKAFYGKKVPILLLENLDVTKFE